MQLQPNLFDSVKTIGLSATIVIVGILGVAAIVRYFMKSSDKKDAIIERKDIALAATAEKKDAVISKLHEERREDLMRMERSLREAGDAFRQGTESLRTGFDELRRELRK